MKQQHSLLFAFLLFILCSITFLSQSAGINAKAALSGGQYLTANETRAIFGDSIPGKFFNGNGYTDVTFQYVNTMTTYSFNPSGVSDYCVSGVTYLHYTCSASGVNNNRDYITVDLQPAYSIFDTSQIHTCIALSTGVDITTTFQSPSWDWYWGGSTVHLENSSVISGTTYRAVVRFDNYNTAHGCTFVPCDFNSQALTSGYSVRACFYGNTPDNGTYHLFLGLPYVDSGTTGTNGTTPATTAPPDINVDVNVDMTETNGLLGQIKSILQGIVDGIKNLFIPSDEALQDFSDDMDELIEDHLGGLYEAEDILTSYWTQFQNVTAMESIYIPACHIPLAGADFVLGNWTVPLKPAGMPAILYTSIAWIIDFLAVASFLNMCRKKLEIFLNPDSEVVESDH